MDMVQRHSYPVSYPNPITPVFTLSRYPWYPLTPYPLFYCTPLPRALRYPHIPCLTLPLYPYS